MKKRLLQLFTNLTLKDESFHDACGVFNAFAMCLFIPRTDERIENKKEKQNKTTTKKKTRIFKR